MTMSAITGLIDSAEVVLEGELGMATSITTWILGNPLALFILVLLFIKLTVKLVHAFTRS